MRLVPVDLSNVWKLVDLQVEDEQRGFVAANGESLIEAWATVQSGCSAYPFGLYEGEEPVGFVMLGYGAAEDPGEPSVAAGNYCLWRFMIDRRYQGKGLGKQAMETVLSFIDTFPYGPAEYCWLSYEPENTRAAALYARYGFRENGESCDGETVAVRPMPCGPRIAKRSGAKERKARLIEKMIAFYAGNTQDIEHFLKVLSYAELIGTREAPDGRSMETLETAAIVHDIACPLCRQKYGSAPGKRQEEESEALLRPFLEEFDLEEAIRERVIWLVCHHHTAANADEADHRILLEADFLVNASENGMSREQIRAFCDLPVRTGTGRRLLEEIYLKDRR